MICWKLLILNDYECFYGIMGLPDKIGVMTDRQTILIIGATGQIGSELLEFFPKQGFSVVGTSRNPVKANEKGLVPYDLLEDIDQKVDLSGIDWCIICAAETSIKKCESDPQKSYLVNVERTIDIIDKCISASVRVLFLSSDSVFDGSKAFNAVTDTPNPSTMYGKQKLEVENHIVSKHDGRLVVVRLTKVISAKTPLLKTWAERLSTGEAISAFTNKVLSPVELPKVCELLSTIINRGLSGVFQLGGSQELSYYDFANQYFGKSANITPGLSEEPLRHSSLESFLPTYEFQYDPLLSAPKVDMGMMTNYDYADNPVRLAFKLSRYKFVSRILKGCNSVLEIGCADAFGSALLLKEVNRLTCCDIDITFINHARRKHYYRDKINFVQNDFIVQPLDESFDGIFLMDVLEHISPENEFRFLENIVNNLTEYGVAIFGMPSLESQVYASEISRQGHVNCKKGDDLKESLSGFFHNVFVFSMNDEVVHTGFYPLAHYLIAVCCSPRRGEK